MAKKKIEIKRNISDEEVSRRGNFFNLFKNTPIPDEEIQLNLGLYINRQNLSRIIFMHDLYKRIINTTGVVMEFGCRWGQNLPGYVQSCRSGHCRYRDRLRRQPVASAAYPHVM